MGWAASGRARGHRPGTAAGLVQEMQHSAPSPPASMLAGAACRLSTRQGRKPACLSLGSCRKQLHGTCPAHLRPPRLSATRRAGPAYASVATASAASPLSCISAPGIRARGQPEEAGWPSPAPALRQVAKRPSTCRATAQGFALEVTDNCFHGAAKLEDYSLVASATCRHCRPKRQPVVGPPYL